MSDPVFNSPIINPFGLTAVGDFASPTFADIDGDGDLDAFVADSDVDEIRHFRNIGSVGAPVFTLDSDTSPFGLINIPDFPSTPEFADIDGDGDLDAFVGGFTGSTRFFRNTGTSAAPIFTLDSDTTPFGLTDVGLSSKPTFADIDGDGDLDAFVGSYNNGTRFFRNTGSASAPIFTLDSDTTPFGLTDVGLSSKPTFVDIDGDGDLDAFVGGGSGKTRFFRNTGSATTPEFTLDSDTSPFDLNDVGRWSKPTFADIDSDGDLDAFVGNEFGKTHFYLNTNISHFSKLTNGQSLVFNPQLSVLRFDSAAISANSVIISEVSGATNLSQGGKTVTLQTGLKSITSGNVTFANGGLLMVGDNTPATLNDDAANSLLGGTASDQLLGLGGDDTLIGGRGNDWIDGGDQNDILKGGNGADRLFGSAGNDKLNGGVGKDSLSGGDGDDTLTGTNSGIIAGEIDTLTGGTGADRFVLGVLAGRLYDNGISTDSGVGEYALITDFAPDQLDRLILDGTRVEYFLGASPVAGVSGTALYHDSNSDGSLQTGSDELIAILQSSMSLTRANTIATSRFV